MSSGRSVSDVGAQNAQLLPTGGSAPKFRPGRHPAASVAVCFAIGILIDRWVSWPLTTWLAGSIAAFVVWFALWLLRTKRLAAVLLLLAWIAAGGAAHHNVWSVVGSDNIVRRVTEDSKPIEVTGQIVSRPAIRVSNVSPETSILPPVDKTQCVLRIDSVVIAGRELEASGQVQLFVTGHLLAQRGDRVAVRGVINRPSPPGNPGEFDYRQYLRRQSIHCVLRAKDPAAVEVVEPVSRLSVTWVQNHARRIAEDILFRTLDADVYPIAAAILLGNRDRITRDLRESFTESGTMHLLAISGLHVGILALFLWRITRLFHLKLSLEVATVIAFIGLYVFVTDLRPSVLRAGILIVSVMVSRVWYRRVSPANSLGLAALVVLLMNPTDLFDVGAQLSFLSVLAISWAVSTQSNSTDDDDVLQSSWSRFWREQKFHRSREIRVMLIVTAMTAPLVAYSFHLYAPIGLAINVFLIHAVALIMISGYTLMVAGYFVPPLAFAPAVVFSVLLRVLLAFAGFAASISFGHRYGPGPSLNWLLVFYAIAGVLFLSNQSRARSLAGVALCGWLTLGLLRGFASSDTDELRCTVLDVGHGSAILLEAPSGQTMLVDIGSIDSAARAVSAVQGCMWERNRVRIDTLAITHADMDHFNGTEKLLEETPIGSIICPSTFVTSTEPGATSLRGKCEENGIPITAVQRGQQLKLGDDVTVDVLHPGEAATTEFEDDNASSLVLLVRFAGKRILLTGDVSGIGRRQILSRVIEPVDVMLAPHHGSKFDNTPELNQWASPGYVIASSRTEAAFRVLDAAYPDAETYVTKRDGAVTCTVKSDGSMTVTAFRPDRGNVAD